MTRQTRARLIVLFLGIALQSGCQRAAPSAEQAATIAARPAQAVQLLTRHLRNDDLQAFARDAVPPPLHAQLETAWREGHTRWPLDELPFAQHLPAILESLAAPDAEPSLQHVFDQQFARAPAQIKSAAASLGAFGAQYIQREGHYSADERQHYAQLIAAVSRWGATAPLADRARARRTIAQLAAAARRTELTSTGDFRNMGMDQSLRRMGAFAVVFKQVLARYGLDLDASLGGMKVTLQQQTGDTAQVRMRYTLGGQDIDTVAAVQRIDGRWYLRDYLRHAQAAVTSPASTARQAVRPAEARKTVMAQQSSPDTGDSLQACRLYPCDAGIVTLQSSHDPQSIR